MIKDIVHIYNIIHIYNTVHDNVHGIIQIYDMLTWHWLMTWHRLMIWQHSFRRMMWYWLMSWRWSMMCRDPIGLKWLCRVNRWRGRCQWTKTVRTIHALHEMTALMMCSIQSELATWRNPKRPNCFSLIAMIYSL